MFVSDMHRNDIVDCSACANSVDNCLAVDLIESFVVIRKPLFLFLISAMAMSFSLVKSDVHVVDGSVVRKDSFYRKHI